jgi:Ca-activated chloride channel family protein
VTFTHRFQRYLTLLLLLIVSAPLTSRAQDGDDVVRVSTELVVLNITVTDKAGQYVPGLTLSDFTIYEDGKQIPAELIASFSLHESPFASVVLLDTSGSMESRLSLARSAAIRFLDRLRADDVAAVYKFDFKVERVQEFSNSRDLAPMAYGLSARGMTALNDAIFNGAKALADRPETRKAIVVLSDGLDTISHVSPDKALDSALAVGATIYAVDMSSNDKPNARGQQTAMMLRHFTERTGGRFVATPGGPMLRDAFANIADELGHQYTLAYRPLNRKRDGKWRKLEVQLAKKDLIVRTRKAYRAPKG